MPNDFKVALESANLGLPLVESKKKSSITRSIIDLSHILSPPEQRKVGLKNIFITRLLQAYMRDRYVL